MKHCALPLELSPKLTRRLSPGNWGPGVTVKVTGVPVNAEVGWAVNVTGVEQLPVVPTVTGTLESWTVAPPIAVTPLRVAVYVTGAPLVFWNVTFGELIAVAHPDGQSGIVVWALHAAPGGRFKVSEEKLEAPGCGLETEKVTAWPILTLPGVALSTALTCCGVTVVVGAKIVATALAPQSTPGVEPGQISRLMFIATGEPAGHVPAAIGDGLGQVVPVYGAAVKLHGNAEETLAIDQMKLGA